MSFQKKWHKPENNGISEENYNQPNQKMQTKENAKRGLQIKESNLCWNHREIKKKKNPW